MLRMTIQDLHTLLRTHLGTPLSCSSLFPPFLGGTRTDCFFPRCLHFPHSAACAHSIFFRRRRRTDDPMIRICIWQVAPQRLLSFFWGVCHFGMSLRMRLQVLVQILLQFRFSHLWVIYVVWTEALPLSGWVCSYLYVPCPCSCRRYGTSPHRRWSLAPSAWCGAAQGVCRP